MLLLHMSSEPPFSEVCSMKAVVDGNFTLKPLRCVFKAQSSVYDGPLCNRFSGHQTLRGESFIKDCTVAICNKHLILE